MGFLGILLLIIFIATSLLLIVMVMIQDDQGEGLGGIFGGSSSTAFGSRSGNILTKTTSILGAVFLASAFALAWINKTPETGDVLSAAQQVEQGQDEWWNQPVADDQEAESDGEEEAEQEAGDSQ
jgi:preprotein translocase subunit SecG